MRYQLVLRRTRSLFKHPSITHRALISSTRAVRYPRKEPARATAPRTSKRSSSSITSTANEAEPESTETQLLATGSSPDPADPPEDADKPKRGRPPGTKESDASSSLPGGLDILWLPQDAPAPEAEAEGTSSSSTSVLPPPELFNEVLTNLYITLHPQTQHRAAYASSLGAPVEPTLALYCPIEGGDYIIDATVRELGRQAGAEVVVLDAVDLAAGECGPFGKAASVMQLPNNPLHFHGPSVGLRSSSTVEEEDDDDDEGYYRTPSSLTLHVVAPSSRSGGGIVSRRKPASPSMLKVKTFFDQIVNIQAPTPEDSSEPSARAPRIIYVRDFTTLAASSASWYPALLSAVRARRQGPLPRQAAPVHSPTTIVFGITPSLVPNYTGSRPGSGGPGMLSYLMSRQNTFVSPTSPPRAGRSEYHEDEASEKARERRLKERLRKWERGDSSLQEEIPQLCTNVDGEEPSGRGSGVVILGGEHSPGAIGFPPAIAQALESRIGGSARSPPEGERATKFYRTTFIVPGVRSLLTEKACRVDRRRQINELAVRMGVASVGGQLPVMNRKPDDASYLEEGTEPEPAARRMWEDWGREVEVWPSVLKVADRAVGQAVAASSKIQLKSTKASLEPVPVEWSAVYEAWGLHRTVREMRKAWVQHSLPKVSEEEEAKKQNGGEEEQTDEVIERLKRDPDLEQHEQRLLGCIVDTASISTTFNHVHLPERTIDSVRTIVSLPLLHPAAFQHGILKEHAMTGCLLFGPPGTGKTLIVRALAKEAGCRMLAVSPSDVMDMYVGEGEKLVRSVFSLARRLSPCVVFIDEIDALFGARSSARESGGAIAHRGVLTEFMQEMDGLKSKKDDNIIVIGATNRPFDLDDAILRRLPRRLLVDLPGEKERAEILRILLRDETLASDVDLKLLAKKTDSFSGSDLKHLCVSAALDSVKERVEVPWRPNKTDGQTTTTPATPEAIPEATSEATPEAPTSDKSSKPDSEGSTATGSDTDAEASAPPSPPRMLRWRNFAVALREITPSSSEMLGTLSDLRKWNEEFGEGRKEKRHKSVWGKGKFGFIQKPVDGHDEAKVADSSASDSKSGTGSESRL
ncbi:hypothetical protein PHLGIDRAFT_102653 [Phlebiopsis gigantea 11061_1 CR5-6]|uniref:AAA+ ATPase domain-containing protein n=1 Tax=Phlebiopsis gigantea (strain 11061_1 CR5-6) TaxID=745531 RepID=A0A0C3SAZ9_PHLG1|nr:hypothetical protein PHLGIDRAFT_102653 [Phlebiopsis gigantea 11061_1 CR5-6]